jgi:hypothetical protein
MLDILLQQNIFCYKKEEKNHIIYSISFIVKTRPAPGSNEGYGLGLILPDVQFRIYPEKTDKYH